MKPDPKNEKNDVRIGFPGSGINDGTSPTTKQPISSDLEVDPDPTAAAFAHMKGLHPRTSPDTSVE